MKITTIKMKHLLLALCLGAFSVSTATASGDGFEKVIFDTDISGAVLDENGEGLPGVSIVIKGTTTGVVTDFEGKYKLSVPDGAVLVFSYIGYTSQEIAVGSNPTINVNMEPNLSELSEIVVIGSRNANRSVVESSVPVDIIDVSDIVKDAAQVELTDILNYVAPSFSSNKQTISDGTDHVDPASLRGLGVDHVLLLVNGKRRHSSSLINVNGTVGRGSVGTDLNTIPVAAIERIEVLRDGAAAQYGSDAIAGVINIVLKKTTDKVFFSGTLGQNVGDQTNGGAGDGDGQRAQFNVNYGFKVGKKGYVNLTGQYQFRGRSDRAGEWTGNIFKTSGSGIYAEDFAAGDLSPYDVGVRLTEAQANALNAANAVTNNLTDSEHEAMVNANGGRRAFTMKVGQSESVNTAVMMNAGFEIAEGAELYFFGGLNSRHGMATGFYRLPYQSRTLTSIYPNGFLPEINSRVFDGSMAGGIRGKINNWNVDFSNTYGTNSFHFLISNTSNASRGNSTATSFNAGGFNIQQNSTNVDFNRYFDDVLSGINVAFGAEYRIETYQISAGEEGSYLNYGNVNQVETLPDGSQILNPFSQTNIFYNRPGGSQVFPGFKPANELKQSRGNVALYFDTEFNFTDNFFVDAAIRYEDYTDFGSTFNWKLAARLAATETIAIRAAVSTGFRAPSLQQRYFNSTSTLFQLNAEGVNVPNEVGTFRNDSKIAKLFGIPNLTNESSLNMSAGFTWEVMDNLNVTVDAYQVSVDDRVVLTGSFKASSSPEIAAILAKANAGSATFFVNGIDTKTTGVDMIVAHSAELGSGTLRTTLAANFTNTTVEAIHIPSSLQGAPTSFFNRTEQNRFEDATPNSKVNLGLVYKINKFNINLTNVRFGEVVARAGSDADPIDQTFAAKVITDLSLGYQFTDALKLTIGGNNILNVYPDENRTEFRSGERFVYSRRVSQFGFNGSFFFGRLNVTF